MPTEAEIAWAAGLIEGEGSFWLWSQQQSGRIYAYPKMQVNSTDEDVLARLQRILGGSLSGPYDKSSFEHPDRKPQWQWSIGSQDEFDRVADMIKPWLLARRRDKLDEIQAAPRGRIR